ncbi:unnamed protein product [Didymodactylos carnosus]|uniref:Oligopeptide transporter n=1 Tax=Didymodactylos carnosus TaxID=1234261 RepID=A0A8S2EWS9_9BILA|nr:unnamed protein product [Didymodactylos carnosus]CAF4141695.1 unnamed protein product [Didymodactylos carnosus]
MNGNHQAPRTIEPDHRHNHDHRCNDQQGEKNQTSPDDVFFLYDHTPDVFGDELNNYTDCEQSSYEEIAGIVSNKDDYDMVTITFRSCLIGVLYAGLVSLVNKYLLYKRYSYSVPPFVLLLLTFPIGKLLGWCLPKRHFNILEWKVSFNPCPFTIKEHAIVYIMVYIASEIVAANDIVIVKQAYYYQKTYFAWGLLLALSSQLMGYGMAGVLRRFLVWPSPMIWPANLPVIALLRTLHEDEQSTSVRWLKLSRIKFFLLAAICQAIYYWFPGYIMPVLASFSWMCMISPKNVILAQLTGYNGLGMGSLVFDWNNLTQDVGSPILIPRWALINVLVGFVCLIWILLPITYFAGLFNFKTVPIGITWWHFTSDGNYLTENVNELINATYIEMHKPIVLSCATAMTDYITFTALASLSVHTVLYHGKDIIQYLQTSLKKRENDIHCTLMAKYPEVPEWWHIVVFSVAFILAIIACKFGHFMPWYYLFVAVPFACLCVLPVGIVQAMTTIPILPIFVARTIAGEIFEGDPVGLMSFMIYAYETIIQALFLTSIFKFGHFMKISSRTLFIVQLSITIVSVIIKYGIVDYIIDSVPNLCLENSDWTCSIINKKPFVVAAVG